MAPRLGADAAIQLFVSVIEIVVSGLGIWSHIVLLWSTMLCFRSCIFFCFGQSTWYLSVAPICSILTFARLLGQFRLIGRLTSPRAQSTLPLLEGTVLVPPMCTLANNPQRSHAWGHWVGRFNGSWVALPQSSCSNRAGLFTATTCPPKPDERRTNSSQPRDACHRQGHSNRSLRRYRPNDREHLCKGPKTKHGGFCG